MDDVDMAPPVDVRIYDSASRPPSSAGSSSSSQPQLEAPSESDASASVDGDVQYATGDEDDEEADEEDPTGAAAAAEEEEEEDDEDDEEEEEEEEDDDDDDEDDADDADAEHDLEQQQHEPQQRNRADYGTAADHSAPPALPQSVPAASGASLTQAVIPATSPPSDGPVSSPATAPGTSITAASDGSSSTVANGAAGTTKDDPSSIVPPPSTAKGKRAPKGSRKKSRSPSPLPPQPPPVQTIRLEITLGIPDHYAHDVDVLAKAGGMRAPTPPPAIPAAKAESESEAADDEGGEGKAKKKRRRKRKSDWYDLDDDFIDDADLAIDERTYFAQTKQQGFYVSSGEVALLRETKPKKPKSVKRLPLLAISASIASPSLKPSTSNGVGHQSVSAAPRLQSHLSAPANGTKEEPIALLSDDDERSGAKRKNPPAPENGKAGGKRRKTDIQPFSPELQAAIEDLKVLIARESWDQKGKFPPGLKPPLAAVAAKAIRSNEYDDNFFNLLPTLFPYNRYTMTKLVKRIVFNDHLAILAERTQLLLDDLRRIALDGFDKAKEEYEKAVMAWERRQSEKTDAPQLSATNSANGAAGGGGSGSTSPAPAIQAPAAADGADSVAPEHERRERGANPPQRRYKLTDELKGVLWALVCISNECVRIENEKAELEGLKGDVSEQGHRKTLYQKIVGSFPEGWMSSQQISREVSVLKKKAEKEAMEIDG